MEIADLKALVTVIEQGGITKAARELNRVPSGITTRILQLEESLGVKLFLREKKKLIVTPKGEELYDYAKKILGLVDEAEWQLKSNEPGGLFRIGSMENTLAARLYQPLSQLHADYLDICIELTTGTGQAHYEKLMDNQLDAIFIADAPADERCDSVPVFEERLCVIAHRSHPPIMSPADIGDTALLAFNEGCAYRARLLEWFEAAGANHGRIVSLASCHAIMGCAVSSMGIGLIPASILDDFPQKDTLSINQLPQPYARTCTWLVWRKGMASANLAALRRCLPPEMQNQP